MYLYTNVQAAIANVQLTYTIIINSRPTETPNPLKFVMV